LNPLLVNQDGVPSVLNCGLSQTSPAFWVAAIGVAAIAEAVLAAEASQSAKLNPGDLGFDPLGLGGTTNEQKHFMQEAELFNGRLGMLAPSQAICHPGMVAPKLGGESNTHFLQAIECGFGTIDGRRGTFLVNTVITRPTLSICLIWCGCG
jgi:hypothetical protein